VVGSGGWVARALVHAGHLPDDVAPSQAFYVATEFLSRPGVFGLILAALTAALMSTVDTLITAVSAIVVNDLYQPHIRPKATDRELLRVARITAIAVTLLGVALVPLFMKFASIYEAHGAFTAAVTPPLVVTLVLSVFWRRFTAKAAEWTLIGGLIAVGVSLFFPEVIAPFAHGVPMQQVDDGFLSGMRQYKFMRACYGIGVSAAIGVLVSLWTRPEPFAKQRGLVWGTIADALRGYKGSPGVETRIRKALATPVAIPEEAAIATETDLPPVRISRTLADMLHAATHDVLYVTDTRRWLGGLRSSHAIVAGIIDPDDGHSRIELPAAAHEAVVTRRRAERPVRVERLY
jgi:SSS family solute:Na+ symporter